MNSKSNRLACLKLVLATVLRGQLVGACSICSSTSPTLCDNIEPADVAVFAAYIGPSKDNPDGIERSEFRIEQIIKGREALGDERVARVLFFPPPDLRPGTMFLVLGNAIPKVRWTTPIRVSKRSIKYIRRMLELPPEGAERLAYALEYIDDTEELMRKDAYDEFGKAPYSMLANLRSNLDADALLGAVQDPKTEAFSLMRLKFTLLSVCVRSQDLPALEKIVRSHGDQYKQCLDAMIACYLNAAGAEGLGVIEAEYLNSEEPDDLTAASSAISALRFHGQENDVIDRDRIIELMRRLLAKPQLAGWIVSDLARWEDWSVLDRVAQLFREADEEDTKWLREPAARYVLACPLPAAKELLPQLEKIDPDSLRVARRMLVRETAAKTDKIEKRDQPDKQDILAGNKETGPPPEPTDGSQNLASGGPNWYVIGGALAAFVVILLLARRRGSPEVTNAS